jgi:hypothetical protein
MVKEATASNSDFVYINLKKAGVNFINVVRSYEILGAKTSNPKHSFVIFGAKISFKNAQVKRSTSSFCARRSQKRKKILTT